MPSDEPRGRGLGACPLLIFRQNWGRKHYFLRPSPLISRSGWPPPHPHPKVWIRHWCLSFELSCSVSEWQWCNWNIMYRKTVASKLDTTQRKANGRFWTLNYPDATCSRIFSFLRNSRRVLNASNSAKNLALLVLNFNLWWNRILSYTKRSSLIWY